MTRMLKRFVLGAVVAGVALVATGQRSDAQEGCRSYAALKGSDGKWHCTVFGGINCIECPPVE